MDQQKNVRKCCNCKPSGVFKNHPISKIIALKQFFDLFKEYVIKKMFCEQLLYFFPRRSLFS